MNVILLGIQGCGKGTQAEKLEKKYGWKHINVGNLFRYHIENGTELGRSAKKYIERGELVPDDFVFQIVESELDKNKNGFILDGFPRNLKQMEFLLDKYPIDKVILLDLAKDIAIQRISSRRNCADCKQVYNLLFNPPRQEGICDKCGGNLVQRADDNEAAVARRIEKFYAETGRVIDFFKEKNKLIVVDASQDIDTINRDIIIKITD